MSTIILDLSTKSSSATSSKSNYTCHVLPCRIRYTGPANVKRYFEVEYENISSENENGNLQESNSSITHDSSIENSTNNNNNINLGFKQTPIPKTYFRGRLLRGKEANMENHKGYVFNPTGTQSLTAEWLLNPGDVDNAINHNKSSLSEANGSDNETELQAQIWEPTSSFNNMVVWGHEEVPDSHDPWIAGTEEWTSLASIIHSPME